MTNPLAQDLGGVVRLLDRDPLDPRNIDKAVQFLLAHSAEIAGALRDAERYRWLRNRLGGKEHIEELVEYNHDAHPELRTEVDAAIDSAMQQGGGGGDSSLHSDA